MTPETRTLVTQAWASVKTPRDVARWVMSFDLSRADRWLALLLVVVLTTLVNYLMVRYLTAPDTVMFGEMLERPMTAALVQMSGTVLAVFAVYWIGHAMGGTGGFGDAISLMAWLQFCMFCITVLQAVSLLLMPPLALILSMASVVLFFWLMTNFVAELHGFTSLGLVFVTIVVSILGISFGIFLILSIIGLVQPGGFGSV